MTTRPWRDFETDPPPKDGTLILVAFREDLLGRKRNHQCIIFWEIKDPWCAMWTVYGGYPISFKPQKWKYLEEGPE